jgi:hypothetical protein
VEKGSDTVRIKAQKKEQKESRNKSKKSVVNMADQERQKSAIARPEVTSKRGKHVLAIGEQKHFQTC